MAWVKHIAHRGRWLIDAQQRCQCGGQIYRLHPAVVDAGSKGRAIKAKGNVAVIGPGTEMRGAAVPRVCIW